MISAIAIIGGYVALVALTGPIGVLCIVVHVGLMLLPLKH